MCSRSMDVYKGRRKEKEMGWEQEKLVMANGDEQVPKSEMVRTKHICTTVLLSGNNSGYFW